MGLERGVLLGCPGIPQDRLEHVGPYISGYPGIPQDGFEHVGLGTWTVVYITGCPGISWDGFEHVGLGTWTVVYITGCPGISLDGLGYVGLYWCVYLGMLWDGLTLNGTYGISGMSWDIL